MQPGPSGTHGPGGNGVRAALRVWEPRRHPAGHRPLPTRAGVVSGKASTVAGNFSGTTGDLLGTRVETFSRSGRRSSRERPRKPFPGWEKSPGAPRVSAPGRSWTGPPCSYFCPLVPGAQVRAHASSRNAGVKPQSTCGRITESPGAESGAQ